MQLGSKASENKFGKLILIQTNNKHNNTTAKDYD